MGRGFASRAPLPRTHAGPVIALILALVPAISGCGPTWNNPYPDAGGHDNTLYLAFSAIPNHLDPARSYAANEVQFIGQIYEPPLQYHYLLRPYTLVPLAATEVPEPVFLDDQGRRLSPDADRDQVAVSVWTLHIQPGIRYQPHPAFATDAGGDPLYFSLTPTDLEGIRSPMAFEHLGTRELLAADYVYQIKRLADPTVNSPIFSLMSEHIVGFRAFSEKVAAARQRLRESMGDDAFLDLGTIAMKGVEVVDRHTFRITIQGRYPQFRYWLAMPFFAPMPVEALRFYHQPELIARNITIDTYPVGTGPYMLTVNNPNRHIVLARNPNFHEETYPGRGEPGDRADGMLADAGQALPFIDKAVYSLEQESIPQWNKFMQGYYDLSGITAESFDQAVSIGAGGRAQLTAQMKARGIELTTAVQPSIFYTGFNMLDDVVGGYTEKARKLRRAISIALDYDAFIGIFLNGRGIPAQGPLPPEIYGHLEGREGLNEYVFQWVDGRPQRRPIEAARRLLAEAGYPGGVDPDTGEPLLLYLDITATGPGSSARLAWYRQQLARLDIQLVIRSTTFNRLQQKMATGNIQLFVLGWNADYPDPENFLFLLYGPNSKARHGGENIANYMNPEFDRLFEKMRHMPDSPQRAALLQRMIGMVRRDAPWVWGFYPKSYSLHHGWVHNDHPNMMANNTLKYLRLEPARRVDRRMAWNRPVLWPLAIGGGLLVAILLPAVRVYYRRESRRGRSEATTANASRSPGEDGDERQVD